jgi:hypothetical protein
MVRVRYDRRLLFDADAVNYLLGLDDLKLRADIFRNLMYVKASSKEHKRSHNLILQEEYEKLKLSDSQKDIVRQALCVTDGPEFLFLFDEDLVSKNVIFSISLASHTPFQTTIVTSPTKKAEYEKNQHYEPVPLKTVNVKGADDAIRLINQYAKEYFYQRQCSR